MRIMGVDDDPEILSTPHAQEGKKVVLRTIQSCFQNRHFLLTLSTADLGRELNEPWYQPVPTVGVRIVSIMADCLEHAGEVSYLRGLLKGKGWLGF